MWILTAIPTAGSELRRKSRTDLARSLSASLVGCRAGKEAACWPPNWRRTMSALPLFRANLTNWPNGFAVWRIEPLATWNGEEASTFRAKSLWPRRGRPILWLSAPGAEDAYHAFDPGMVLLNAGRPVLIVPDGLGEHYPGRRVLVAWKETREARHAVHSALPYLRMAEHIALVEIAENVLEAAARERLDDVEQYLLRHGIVVNKKAVLNSHGSISDLLRNEASKESADLIVAGAYGHTRLGEWVFGGVTRGLLQKCEVCCLFSN
jgi:nucleotide-binding universal stress UspA family protein